MAEMSPVELLRAAAARVREIAKDATDGPWWSDQSEQCYRLHGVHANLGPAWPGGPAQVMNRQILKAPKQGTTMAEYWPSDADDAWMTTMHPGLAEPLADWLDEAARSREAAEIAAALINGNLIGDDGPVDVERLDDTADARRVARVLLGVPDGR